MSNQFYGSGKSLAKATDKDLKSRISNHGWRLLNLIWLGKKDEFIIQINRIYNSANFGDRSILHKINNSEGDEFKRYALDFMMGYLSDTKKQEDKKDEYKENNNEEVKDV